MSGTPVRADDESLLGLLPNGRPDPLYALALGFVPASALKRSIAFTIDATIWIALALIGVLGTLPLWLRLRPDVFSIGWLIDHHYFFTGLIFFIIGQGLLLIYGLVQLILHGIGGATIGKRILGLRTVRVGTFKRPGFWRIVVRAIIVWGSLFAIPILGAVTLLLSPLWDSERRGRGWHDKAVGCWMLDIRLGLHPTDTKALRLARKAIGADAPLAAAAPLPSLATRTGQAAAVEFVPSSRSSSGVIAAHHSAAHAGAKEPWQPPPLGGQLADAPTPDAPLPDAPHPATPPGGRSTPPDLLEELRPASSASQLAATTVSGSAVFRFESGATVGIDGTGLLGRNPHPQPGEDVLHLLPISDESLQISKTHAAFGIDDRGFWITDRGSSNGTIVVSPGGEQTELIAGQRLYLEWGSTVEVGGRHFTVEAGQP